MNLEFCFMEEVLGFNPFPFIGFAPKSYFGACLATIVFSLLFRKEKETIQVQITIEAQKKTRWFLTICLSLGGLPYPVFVVVGVVDPVE